jgi:KipI family sensor histidine kinase inhibitor
VVTDAVPAAPAVRLRPMGDRAVLAEVDDAGAVLALHAALGAAPPPGVVDLVPAARTVLVVVDPAVLPLPAARSWIAGIDVPAAAPAARTPLVEVPICYDGADLDETAALLGVTRDELVAVHRAARWTVAFTGFAPGFGYLVSDDWPFDVPRLASPRTRVPAGSVGLAAAFSGAYPRETPGGWRLIGTTDAPLFDPASDPPVLLAPGARVRFVETGQTRVPADPAHPAATDAAGRGFTVTAAGPGATVQDAGRGGRASLGIARSGALDRGALRLANRLVGNPEDAAGLEITLGGFAAIARAPLQVALAGVWGPVTIDGRAVDPYAALPWPAGAELRLGTFSRGLRGMLAVRGGVAVPPIAGARATDVLAGLGPAPLAPGDDVPVGPEPSAPVPAAGIAPWSGPAGGILDIRLAPGPRADRFDPAAVVALYSGRWTLSADSDRVGMRLDGPDLPRLRADELPSEGMVPGALQVPPSGRPTVLLADGPVTGGYPVIAVVVDADLDALAQARPGDRLRFHPARSGP